MKSRLSAWWRSWRSGACASEFGSLIEKITAGALTRNFAYSYNPFCQVLTATDPRGNVTDGYDAKGDLTSVTNALGHVSSITSYDGAGVEALASRLLLKLKL